MSIRKYQLETDRTTHLPGRLIFVSTSLYEGDWKSIRHTHPFVELFYVKSGSGSFLVENQSFPINKDELIIINPNVEHTEVSNEDSPLEYITLGIEDFQFSFSHKGEYLALKDKNVTKNLGIYFSSILKEVERNAPGCELICQNFLEILTLLLMRQTNSAFELIPVKNTTRECSRIKRYIDSNYQDDITLDSLAEMAHLNKYYFVHAFTKFYGQSPIQYLTTRRLKTSRDLLETSDYTISEIAQLSGFSSPSYFAQCFRKNCGMTALTYRNRSRSKNENSLSKQKE